MVIINRNDLSIRSMNRVNRAMLYRAVAGFGAMVTPAGSPSPRPFHWPELAHSASTPGNLAEGYPVQRKLTAKPTAEATRLESEVPSFRIASDYPSHDRTSEPTDLATTTLPVSSQLCAPATTAQK